MWEQAESGMLMNSHTLFRSWWETYGTGRSFVCGTAREKGRLVAAVMLLRKNRGPSVLPVRLLRCFGPWHTGQRNAVLHLPGMADAAVALVQELSESPGQDAIVVGRLDPRHEQASALLSHLPRTTRHAYPDLVRLWIEGGFETHLASRSRNFRKSLRKSQRKLDDAGRFEVQLLRGAAVDGDAIDRMLEVDRLSWKKESIVGLAAPERVEFFRRFFSAASDRGWSRLYFLKHGERDVAFTYLIDAVGTVTGYKMSYTEEFGAYSPGGVLLARAVEDSFSLGMQRFDFFNYDVGYHQQHWSNDSLPQIEVVAYAATLTGIPTWLARRAFGSTDG